MFLLKHPYDVGDSVVIDSAELVVKRISLLYTVFTQTAREVQSPNIVLHGLWIDNITRSKVIKEHFPVFVAARRGPETVKVPAAELQTFRKDFHGVDVQVKTVAFTDTETVGLHCEMQYICPQSDIDLRAHVRAAFIKAVVEARTNSRAG